MAEKKKTNRAPAGAGSITKRKDGTWQGSISMGINPATGKTRRKYVYAPSEKECVKKLQALQADLARGTYQEPLKMTVGQWLDMWIADYLGGVKPATIESYTYHVEQNIKPSIGSLKLQNLKPHHVQSMYNDLQRAKALSPKTIRNLHGAFHKSMNRAVALGYIQRNPADNAVLPRVEKAEVHILSEDQLSGFLEAISGHRYELLYFITVFTGMRQGEVLGLSWDCVDFERGTLTINKQLVRNRGEGPSYILASTKNDKPRRIVPAPAVMTCLQVQRDLQGEWREMVGKIWGNADNLVFTNEIGRYVTPYTVFDDYKKIVKDLGVPELRFHDLRHTYAVNAIQAGDDIKTVQGNLGHHTAAFTLDVYGHLTDKMQRESAERMERLIRAAVGQKEG